MVTGDKPRPLSDLAPLLRWLKTGAAAKTRLDFATGTALPDGRLDMCKQNIGPLGAGRLADALRPGVVRHLLLGTDQLGDQGAEKVARRAGDAQVETLYLGCNNISATGVCRIADNLRASPQALSGVWLKRNPLGSGGGDAAAELLEAARELRTLDLVQTGLDPAGLAVVTEAVVTGNRAGRHLEQLFAGGNRLGPVGAASLATLLAAGAVRMLYASAADLGDEGADVISEALRTAPYGKLTRLSLASNGIGPAAAARLVAAAAAAGVELVDLGRVNAAGVLGASNNRIDREAAGQLAAALVAGPHRLTHLLLRDTGMDSSAAHAILDRAPAAVSPTRYLFGKGVARSVRDRLDGLSRGLPKLPPPPGEIAAVYSVYR